MTRAPYRGAVGLRAETGAPRGILGASIQTREDRATTGLVRRGRAIAHTEMGLTAGMWLVGCAYNFCWLHDSLRLQAPAGACWRWQERTPAMAAGLTNHRWTMRELLGYQVPLPAGVAPKRRGRPPKRALQPALAVAA